MVSTISEELVRIIRYRLCFVQWYLVDTSCERAVWECIIDGIDHHACSCMVVESWRPEAPRGNHKPTAESGRVHDGQMNSIF